MFLPLRAWKEALLALGFVPTQKPSRKKARKSRGMRLESLEDRRMMALLIWDPTHSGGAHLGGSGTWDKTSNQWWNGTADVAWSNPAGNTAVFSGASGGNVTISSAVTAGEVDFTTTAYALAGTAGDLTISGSGKVVNVASGISDSIDAVLGAAMVSTKPARGR